MKDKKKLAKIRRSKRTRMHIRTLGATRLTVHRSLNHIYAQIIGPSNEVITSASSLESAFKEKYGGNVKAAQAVGKLIGQRAQEKGIKSVAFDRSGYAYHGRVKALADGAREGGLEF